MDDVMVGVGVGCMKLLRFECNSNAIHGGIVATYENEIQVTLK